MRKGNGPLRWLAGWLPRRDGSPPSEVSGRPSESESWSGSVKRIRAFAHEAQTTHDWGALCERIAALLGCAGCAVIRWDAVAQCGRPAGVAGQWEEEDLSSLLGEGRCEWALALPDASVFASRLNGRACATPSCSKGGVTASAVAVPLRFGRQRLGVLLLSYPAPRVIDRSAVAGGELLSVCVALLCSQQELAGIVERQAKRIARLVDDIERMSISLRGGPARNDGGRASRPS